MISTKSLENFARKLSMRHTLTADLMSCTEQYTCCQKHHPAIPAAMPRFRPEEPDNLIVAELQRTGLPVRASWIIIPVMPIMAARPVFTESAKDHRERYAQIVRLSTQYAAIMHPEFIFQKSKPVIAVQQIKNSSDRGTHMRNTRHNLSTFNITGN